MNPARFLPILLGLVGAASVAAPLPAARDGDPPALRGAIAAARTARPDVARRQLLEAADSAPEIADWLRLRAAALAPDSLERDSLYARLSLPAARARITATEAAARERAGDLAGAARRYDSLGQFTDATRLRLRQATTSQQRAALRAGLLSIARQRAGTPAAAEALRFLASPTVVLTPQEELKVARLAASAGVALEAALLYSKVVRRGGTAAADLLAYGRSLASLRRHREAITTFRRVPSTSPHASQALLGEAASQARLGQRSAASAALQRVVARYPNDSLAVSRALYLAGSLRWDTGDHTGAREHWIPLLERFPHADSIGRAGFLAALALYETGKLAQAADEWQRVHLLDRGADGQAAGYWAGRAAEEQGDSARALLLWRSVMARDSLSYYAYVSATRLGIPGWRPAQRLERFTRYDDLDSAMTRIVRLKAVGMLPEAGWERGWLIGERVRSTERLLAVGDAYRRRGDAEGSIAAARAPRGRGAGRGTPPQSVRYPPQYAPPVGG
ncbi:MAG: tetratricopeptide repeat protein, partial [Gemmatimonadota bacterium]|nr:tetratricopeptide repeat protein [Gemmatimonadota bacterium]